jgi:SPP1 family predicted phage head-tail adaptor
MSAGKYRHRISIERRTDTFDEYGEGQPTWSALLDNYAARVRDDSQREFTSAMQVQAEKSIRIEIRDPRVEITTKDRVTFEHPTLGAKTYDIRAVLAGENIGRDLVLVCSEHSSE